MFTLVASICAPLEYHQVILERLRENHGEVIVGVSQGEHGEVMEFLESPLGSSSILLVVDGQVCLLSS
jgi:hypothetical protein